MPLHHRCNGSIRGTGSLFSLFALLIVLPCHAGSGTTGAGILTQSPALKLVREHLQSAGAWHPFPRAGERLAWEGLPATVCTAYVREAEKFLHGDWRTPKATEFLEYSRNGNRSRYQSISFGRREQLATLVLAECIEGNGRFRDDIVNGIWTICEETYWGVPAHVGLQRNGPGLPDVTEPTVDLFAAETGALLAWTYYLLKDSLDAVSPLVSERIRVEVDRRINAVNLARNDFWWMGLTRDVNNWTPWICSNWLATVLICERDPDRRARSVVKILECLDRFLAGYADDGGCDEGPGYWGRAGGSLFDCLELLTSASGGAVDYFRNPRIREIGRYIMRAHINGGWFVNFADAAARLRPDAPVIFRYGKAISDSTMMQFGSFLAREQRLGEGMLPGGFGVLGRVLPALFGLEEIQSTAAAAPYLRDSWFPGIQVMTARSSAGTPKGLFLSAQGGHNAESHNHNDVGNFVVYLDGAPIVIDVGVETYTAKTFGKDRYSIWTMQSPYHNLPTINGVAQRDGKSFAAKEVRYAADDTTAMLSMEIAGAYPPEAGVRSWRRTLRLERGREREAVIHDAYELTTVRENLQITLMTCREPDLRTAGTIILSRSPGALPGAQAEILYDPKLFTARAETIAVEDPQLQSSWGRRIWRILLAIPHTPSKHEFDIRVRERQNPSGNSSVKPLIDHALTVARTHAINMAQALRNQPDRLPRTLTPGGQLETCGPDWWTSGFFPGILWYLYEYSGDPELEFQARQYSKRVESQKSVTSHHDVGFMIFCSFGNGYRLTGDSAYREVLRTAARSLSTRFNPLIGAIRSWGYSPRTKQWQYPVIIDNMMNLELLMWAAKEFGDKDLARIATTHANTTIRNHFRGDYSTYHVVSYDTVSGAPEAKHTSQGYAHESTWARGEAWGLYGFTMMFRETGDSAYLRQAQGMADFIIHHPRLPGDKIPYWDFDAPGIPNEPRDASAGAIICSALLELARYVDRERSEAYRTVAETQIRTLCSAEYLAEPGTNGNFILKHGVGNKPGGTEVDVPLTYADYYFVEALTRYGK